MVMTMRRMPVPALRARLRRLCATALSLVPLAALATEPVPAGLPPLTGGWLAVNPYRGDAAAAAIGGQAYARHCAQCHGSESARTVPEAPDLRRLNSTCNRLNQAALRPRCLADVDAYYLMSVREGKLRAGLRHMPAWEGQLPQETIWAIRSFTETRPLPPPRTLPDLPPGGALVTR
jgi:mono/diheme cytochrome c family protein